jgi:hypothetical protein
MQAGLISCTEQPHALKITHKPTWHTLQAKRISQCNAKPRPYIPLTAQHNGMPAACTLSTYNHQILFLLSTNSQKHLAANDVCYQLLLCGICTPAVDHHKDILAHANVHGSFGWIMECTVHEHTANETSCLVDANGLTHGALEV